MHVCVATPRTVSIHQWQKTNRDTEDLNAQDGLHTTGHCEHTGCTTKCVTGGTVTYSPVLTSELISAPGRAFYDETSHAGVSSY